MKYKIQNTYNESTLKTLKKLGKIYLIYTTLESGEGTKIDTVWEKVPRGKSRQGLKH